MSWAAAHREGAVAAQYCQADYDVDISVQVDVFGTLRDQGILTVFRALPKLAGAYYPNDGRPGVLLNANHPMSKQRYTAAHELGHHYLGHGTSIDPEIDALNQWGDRSPPQKEKVAEAFAAWFLMPRRLILSILDRNNTDVTEPRDAYALSLRLGTSYEATTRHLANVELISRQVAERWLRETPPRNIKRGLAGPWAPPNIRNEVWVVGSADEGLPVTVTPGDRVIVRVPETPSTGYSWTLANDDAPPGVTAVGEDYDGANPHESTSREGGQAVGEPSEHLIVLEVAEDAPEGHSPITFVHSQPWNPGTETDRFTLDLRVRHYVRGAPETYFLESAA